MDTLWVQQNFLFWCVGAEVVTFTRKPFVSDHLTVGATNSQTPSVDLKIAAKGEWDVPLAGATYRFKRTRGFLGEQFELRAPNGELVPKAKKRITPLEVPPGSQCATHPADAATLVCARCGTFSCAACSGADLLHCRTCLQKELVEQQRNANAALYFTPAVLFMYFGGLLGVVLGLLAGAGASAFARRSENKALKILVAMGLYGVAFVVLLVLVTLISSR